MRMQNKFLKKLKVKLKFSIRQIDIITASIFSRILIRGYEINKDMFSCISFLPCILKKKINKFKLHII